jgi:hypothetical protein
LENSQTMGFFYTNEDGIIYFLVTATFLGACKCDEILLDSAHLGSWSHLWGRWI